MTAEPNESNGAKNEISAKHSSIPLLSEAIVLAVMSGLSLLYTYIFERAYLLYFGIPSDFVRIGTEQIIHIFFTIIVFVVLFSLYIEILTIGLALHGKMRSGYRALLIVIVVVSPEVIFTIQYGSPRNAPNIELYIAGFIGVSIVVLSTVLSHLMNRNKFDAIISKIISRGVIFRFIRTISFDYFILLFISISYFPFEIHQFGKYKAEHQEIYFVPENENNWVLVQAHDTFSILTEFDPSTKRLTGKYRFLEIGLGDNQIFERKEVGPLFPAE